MRLTKYDLRIGDAVSYKGVIMNVTSIKSRKDLDIVVLNNLISCYIEKIEPIELDAKIFKLLNFSLEHDDIIDWYEWVSSDELIRVGNLSNMVGYNLNVHIDNNDFQSIGSGNVKYLHELQQLVYLCSGKELEVDINELNSKL